MGVFEGDPREHAYELIAANACDHVVGAQACAERIRYGDKERVPSSMASRVIRRLEAIDVDVGGHEVPAGALRPIDLAPNGCQPSATTAGSGQLVGAGILTVLGCLGAIFGRNLAVVDGLSAILGRHLAVVDCAHAAVRSLSTPRCGQDTFVCCALTVSRRAIPGRPVEIAHRVVTRFGLAVTQPGRNVAVLCSQAGLPTANRRQLVSPGILAVFRGLRPILGRNLPIVDRAYAAVRSLSAPRVRAGAFVSRALPSARRAIARGSISITRRIVARFGFLVTELGGDVTLSRSQPSLPTARGRQLVDPGILAVPGRLRAIIRCDLAVVHGSNAAVRSLSAAGGGPSALVCRAPAVAGGAISGGSIKIAGGVIAGFGFSVTELGRNIPCARRQRGIFAIPGRLCAIFGGELAVVDGLSAVVRGLGPPRSGLGAFVRRVLTVASRAIPGGAIEIARRVVTRFGLSVTQPGCNVAVLGSQPSLSPPYSRQLVGPGIKAVLGGVGAIFGRNPAVVDGLRAVVCGSSPPRGGLDTFVCRILAVARGAIPGGSVEIARGIVTRFRLSVAQPGGDVTVLCSQPGLAAPHSIQLVGPRILAVFGGVRSIFGCNLAVVDCLGAVVRSLVVRRGSSVAFARLASTVARRAIP
jgi:hypothetical protein